MWWWWPREGGGVSAGVEYAECGVSSVLAAVCAVCADELSALKEEPVLSLENVGVEY